MKVDLNADLGEGFGRYPLGMDEEIMKYISSANVACGFHASDPVIMDKTACLAKKAGIKVGAHPGFPDLVGFGRRNMKVSSVELKAMVKYQIGALNAICISHGLQLSHVKPHGAMYNMAAKDMELAKAIAQGVKEVDSGLILLGLSGSCLTKAAEETGLMSASEVFADRAYHSDGTLVERSIPGAVLTDETEVIARIIDMIQSKSVVSIEGDGVPVKPDSICLHGDGSKAVEFAGKINKALLEKGIEITNIRNVIQE